MLRRISIYSVLLVSMMPIVLRADTKPFLDVKSMHQSTKQRGALYDLVWWILAPFKEYIKIYQEAVVLDPYKSTKAQVRLAQNPLCAQELDWRKKRFAKVKAAQEALLGMQLADDEVLEIGVSLSGGGYRAMLAAAGSMAAAEAEGILPCIMTVAGLSGSTWFLAPWITSGMSACDYAEYIACHVGKGPDMPDTPEELDDIADALMIKFAYDQQVTLVDLYGALLGNALLTDCGNNRQRTYLASDICTNAPSHVYRLAQAEYPLPVYTAVLGDFGFGQEWFEFTPYEVGSRWLEAYIPSWSFGRTFDAGVSTDYAPSQPLSYIMGICGSAFAASFAEVYEVVRDHIPYYVVRAFFDSVLKTEIGQIRLTSAEFNNFAYKLDNSALREEQLIELVDAGVEFNNPVFATYRNEPAGDAPDIILVFDYSDVVGSRALAPVAEYAQKKNIPCPSFQAPGVTSNSMTVFKGDSSKQIPTIIYMPRVKDQALLDAYKHDAKLKNYCSLLADFDVEQCISSGYGHLFNFIYSQEQATEWIMFNEFNLLAHAQEIKKIIKSCVLEKKAQKGIKEVVHA